MNENKKEKKEFKKEELKKYPPGEANVEGVAKIMLPKTVEIENAHEVFTNSFRNTMVSYISNDFIMAEDISKLNWFQKFFRWLKRIVKE